MGSWVWIHRRVITVLQMLKFPKQKGEKEEGEGEKRKGMEEREKKRE